MVKSGRSNKSIYNSIKFNPKTCNSTDQTLSLLRRGHQFESNKPQSHWRLTWSLISGPVGLVKVHANWPGHPH
jgi:hypothetical protein